MAEPSSKWTCPKCALTYDSPIAGTAAVSHECEDGKARRFKRVARTKYDKMEG